MLHLAKALMGKDIDKTELAKEFFEKGYQFQKSGHIDRKSVV